jgi:hypothetical protein
MISFHLLDSYFPTSASAVARTSAWKTSKENFMVLLCDICNVSLRTLFEARYEEVQAQYLVVAVKTGVFFSDYGHEKPQSHHFSTLPMTVHWLDFPRVI